MKSNMGTSDRLIRLTIAAAFVVLYLIGIIKGTTGLVLIGISIIFVLTSLVSVCPLYFPFGMSTKSKSTKRISDR